MSSAPSAGQLHPGVATYRLLSVSSVGRRARSTAATSLGTLDITF